MEKTKLCICLVVCAFVVIAVDVSPASADEVGSFGPPAWVMAAWESGSRPVIPDNGPPAWVVDAWQSGQMRAGRPGGVPPWVSARQAMAEEMNLPGPPTEVIDAWKNGKGFDLPGPPDFVLDLFGFLTR